MCGNLKVLILWFDNFPDVCYKGTIVRILEEATLARSTRGRKWALVTIIGKSLRAPKKKPLILQDNKEVIWDGYHLSIGSMK